MDVLVRRLGEADKTNFEKVSEEELIYNVCDECGEIFENQDKLTKHSLNHGLRENIVIEDIPETIDKQDSELKEEDIKIEEDKNKKQKYHHAARVLSEVIKKNKSYVLCSLLLEKWFFLKK